MASVSVLSKPDRETVKLARQAVDREPTNWRTWLTLVRIEATTGQVGLASRDVGKVRETGAPAAFTPSQQELIAISEFKADPLGRPIP
jgi:hypothetical protein